MYRCEVQIVVDYSPVAAAKDSYCRHIRYKGDVGANSGEKVGQFLFLL